MCLFLQHILCYTNTKWLKKMRYKNSNIRKCLNTKTIALCAAFFLYCLLPLKGICQTGESTVDALVEMGFEMLDGQKMAMNVCMFCRTLHIVCKA